MKVDFGVNTIIPNFYGGSKACELAMFVDDKNKILRGKLVQGASIGLHKHETSSEIIYVISGKGRVICDDVEEIFLPGDCHYCQKGSNHALFNDDKEDLVFFAVVPQQ